MTISRIEESQRKAARVAGFTLLSLLAAAGFAEFYVRFNLIVYGDAAGTALRIMGSERLFRLGIASDLIASAGDVVLAMSLYVLLKPVNRSLALLAAFWRLAEASILAVTTVSSFVVLRLLSGADYLNVFQTDQLQGLARLFISEQSAGYNVGLIFFSLGSAVFSYLLFKSRYIPPAFAVSGMHLRDHYFPNARSDRHSCFLRAYRYF
jgi:hypothetical protein